MLEGRGASSCRVWASENRACEWAKDPTRLDSGISHFQKKANSRLGQDGVLQIIQEPRVLGTGRNHVLRPPLKTPPPFTWPLSFLLAVDKSSSSPGKNSDPSCHWQELMCLGGGRNLNLSPLWGQASLPSTQPSQATLFPSLPGAVTFLPLGRRCQTQGPNYRRRPPPAPAPPVSQEGQPPLATGRIILERGKMVPTNPSPQTRGLRNSLEEVSQNVRGHRQERWGATQTSQSQLYDDLMGVKSPGSLLIG